MHWIKRSLFLLFSLFVFVGSTGFYVFEHSCKMDGTETSLFIQSEHQCEEDVILESCCHKPEKEKDQDCCSDEVKVVQVNYDYFHSGLDVNFAAILPAIIQPIYVSLVFNATKVGTIVKHDSSPPPKSGREIGIAHQVFRC